MSPTRFANAIAVAKFENGYVRSRCPAGFSAQPFSSCSSSSATRAGGSGGTPPRQGTHRLSASAMFRLRNKELTTRSAWLSRASVDVRVVALHENFGSLEQREAQLAVEVMSIARR